MESSSWAVPHVTQDKPLGYYLRKPATIKVKSTVTSKLSEETVVKQCTDYLRLHGWLTKTLYTGGIPLGNGRFATNPAVGVPDCMAFHRADKRMIFIEYKKSQGGLLSQDQKQFHDLLRMCDQEVLVVNSLESLKEQLEQCQK